MKLLNMYNLVISIVPADGLALCRAKKFSGAVMKKNG